MKPLVISKAKKPRSFKGININNLPVYWNANKKAWVTATLFNDWFHNSFVPDVKRYLIKKGLPFKVLLVLDNAPGHPKDLQEENVEIVFLPKNTTSLLQPLDQGIISTFKALYIKKSFKYILDQMENEESLSIIDAWKKFTMLDCVKHIGMSYVEIKQSTLHACWKAVWPNIVEGENHRMSLEQEYSQIIELGHTLGGEGFEDITEVDIAEIMEDQELHEDDLIEMVQKIGGSENDVESDVDECEPSAFTAKVVREGLAIGRKLGNYFQEYDTNVERALKFQRDINKLLSQYEEVYKDMTKNKPQLLISDFFSEKSHGTTSRINTSPIERESNEIVLSSDESE